MLTCQGVVTLPLFTGRRFGATGRYHPSTRHRTKPENALPQNAFRGSVRAAALALAFILLAPTVVAVAGTGTITTRAGLDLPPNATLDAALLGLYATDVEALTLTAQRVTVHRMTLDKATLSTGLANVERELSYDHATYTLHDVTIDATRTSAGWLGAYPKDARVSSTLITPATLSPTLETILGNSPTPEREPHPNLISVSHAVRAPHATTTLESASLTGGVVLKFVGLSGVMESQENTSSFTTSRHSTTDAATTGRDTWMLLEVEEATVTMTGRGMVTALGMGEAAWASSATARDSFGELHLARAASLVRGDVALEGDLRSTLSPAREAGGAVLRLSVQGDWRSDLHVAGSIQAPVSPSSTPLLLGAGALLAATVLALTLARTVHPKPPAPRERPLTASTLLERGDAHMLRAEYEEALAAYDEASLLLQDGEADLRAACAASRLGYEADAAAFVRRALSKSPGLALDVRENEALKRYLLS